MTGANENIIIFGGTGDLSYRKLIPALHNLFVSDKLQENTKIIVVGRRDYSNEDYISIIKDWTQRFTRVEFTEEQFQEFSKIIQYHRLDLDNIPSYQSLSPFFVENTICYYAVAPRYFNVISEGLSTVKKDNKVKIVVEKPFGETLEDANRLNLNLENWFGKENIYHIDHYLGKEMIQNILSVRFKNPVFANNWNNGDIEYVYIIASEKEGVGTRGGYYDKSGALTDMLQNHLMQILSIVSLAKPDDLYSIKERQTRVLKQLRPVEKLDISKHLLLGQYEGYREENLVNPQSQTETFAFCKLYIDNHRWSGVPFYIMTGKELKEREMYVVMTFKSEEVDTEPNVLTFKIQPMEGISLLFNVKKPGETAETIQTEMEFAQNKLPAYKINTPEAYERLLYAVIEEDHTWFSSWDLIYTSWVYVEELRKKYSQLGNPLHSYARGSGGPEEISQILEKESHRWTHSLSDLQKD